MQNAQTVVVYTNGGYYAKGATLEEALHGAKYRLDQLVLIKFVATDPVNVTVDSGGVYYPKDVTVFDLTNGFVRLRAGGLAATADFASGWLTAFATKARRANCLTEKDEDLLDEASAVVYECIESDRETIEILKETF